MRYDLFSRPGFREQLDTLAKQMREWETISRVDDEEAARLRDTIQPFSHATVREGLLVAGVDGTGDYPSVSYEDSFVFVTLAQATTYEADPSCGLREVGPPASPIVEFTWVPEEETRRNTALDASFERLAEASIDEVIERSDYRVLRGTGQGRGGTVADYRDSLIRPHATDAGNIGIQLRSTGELGAALRVLRSGEGPQYLLMDGTLSLPFVGSRGRNSLFHEHLRRLCCVEARGRNVLFAALSKSHGLPAMDRIEEIAREKLGLERGKVAEHWYLRLPTQDVDGWELSLAEGRRLPPAGAVTYLFRFHRSTPVMRLDIDREYWQNELRGNGEAERRIFEDLDYASHDQRSYGYPYPIKAGHDRASLTEGERQVLRKQIIDAAVAKGLRRSLFRSAALATGHE